MITIDARLAVEVPLRPRRLEEPMTLPLDYERMLRVALEEP